MPGEARFIGEIRAVISPWKSSAGTYRWRALNEKKRLL
jgi:hypothetical protein